MKKLFVLALVAVGLAACGATRQDRAVTGGLIGAGAGAAIGAVATGTAGGAIAGGVLGGAAGAIIGGNTGGHHHYRGRRCVGHDRYGNRVYYRC